MSEPRNDRPRTNRDPAEIDRKLRLLSEPHVVPLAREVKRLRKQGRSVPMVDPTDAGTGAPILLLLETPGPQASLFASVDNDDPSAENAWRIMREVGMDRAHDLIAWNVVPWALGGGRRNPTDQEVRQARPMLERFVKLLPDLRVVVLMGRKAQSAWSLPPRPLVDLPVIETWHTSAQALNRSPERRGEVCAALTKARRMAGLN